MQPMIFETGEEHLTIAELQGARPMPPIPPGYQGLPQGLPLVEIIESFKGPWNKSGSYGQQKDFSYPATLASAEPITIFNNDGFSGPPQARTFQLFRSDVSLGFGNAELYARFTYGVGGIQNELFIDWVRGTQLALVCQTVRIDAFVYQPNAAVAYSPPSGTEVLGVMVGQSPSAPPRPPTFTTQRVNRTPSAIDELAFDIPDLARWAYPSQVSPTLGALNATDLMFFRSNGSAVLRTLTVNQDLMLQGSVIPGGSTIVSFLNQGPQTMQYAVTFQLGL